MVDKLKSLINDYQMKYPLLNRNGIIEQMVKDGVFNALIESGEIKPTDIEKLKNGSSLFNFNNWLDNGQISETNSTEIWGGYFSNKNKNQVNEKEPYTAPIVKPHKITSLVDVNANGEIFTSQFTIEGIRKKYSNTNFNIIEENDDYGTYITVYNKNNNKKIIEYDISKESSLLGINVSITKYNTAEEDIESVIVSLKKPKGNYISRHDKVFGDTAIATFYEYKNPNNIQKTYKYKKQDDIWDINEITLYTNNKPYKKFDGTYDNTIINYVVDELTKSLKNLDNEKYTNLANAYELIKTFTQYNVYEMLYDYQNKTGRDLLDDIEALVDTTKQKFGNFYTVEGQFGFNMMEHLKKVMNYDGALNSDSWLNDHREEYITNRLINDLKNGKTENFKQDLKLVGININPEDKKMYADIFGNTMIKKVLISFQNKSKELHSNSNENITKGLLYTIATSHNIEEKERAEIILDTITQLGFLNDFEVKKEISDFFESPEFMKLVTKYCSEGKYCDDIIADMILNSNNPDKILVDFKRLKARNEIKKENSYVSKPNEKIDIDFQQGNTGDCWLLAGVISLCKKKNGKERLESLLKVDTKTGDVTVTLKGVNKSYKISAKEIEEADHLAGGDGDMRALELALDKYIRELAYNKELNADQVDIQGNTTHYLYEVLLGKGEDFGKYKRTMNEDFNHPNKAFCLGCGILDTPYKETFEALIDSKGQPVDFVTGHAYAIEKADEKYVYLVNPWDSKETLRITHEKLEILNANVGICNF